MNLAKNVIIAGNPGSGKTSLVRDLCRRFPDRVGGFYTDEARIGAERDAFILNTLDGRQGIFAKKGMKSPVKLNKYGVDLAVLETLGMDAVRRAMDEYRIIVIDELGAMSVLSEPFRLLVMECLASPHRVLATIRRNARAFTEVVSGLPDTSLLTLTRADAGAVRQSLEGWVNGPHTA